MCSELRHCAEVCVTLAQPQISHHTMRVYTCVANDSTPVQAHWNYCTWSWLCLCTCVRACVRACIQTCVRACACACVLQSASRLIPLLWSPVFEPFVAPSTTSLMKGAQASSSFAIWTCLRQRPKCAVAQKMIFVMLACMSYWAVHFVFSSAILRYAGRLLLCPNLTHTHAPWFRLSLFLHPSGFLYCSAAVIVLGFVPICIHKYISIHICILVCL